MSFTLRNLKGDLEDVGSNFDGAPDLEFRLATDALELKQSGLSYQRVPPDYRFPYGHTHKTQEEVYVVVARERADEARRRDHRAQGVGRGARPARHMARLRGRAGGPRDPRHRRAQPRRRAGAKTSRASATGGLTSVAKLIYSMNVSLDGFVEGPDGDFGWGVPDEELHRFHNAQVKRLSAHLLGRKLYETMVYWETAEQDPAISDYAAEFARIWKQLPKVVCSSTLTEVEGNTRLATGSIEEEVARLKSEYDGEIAVGGPGLAGACARLDLIDEYVLFAHPTIVGGGLPYFPDLTAPLELKLIETRTFGNRVVHTRYERLRPQG